MNINLIIVYKTESRGEGLLEIMVGRIFERFSSSKGASPSKQKSRQSTPEIVSIY